MSLIDKAKRQKFLSFTLMVFTVAAGIVIATVTQTGAKAAKEGAAAPDATPLTIPAAVVVENEFSKVAKQLEPSVVNISSEYIPTPKPAANRGGNRRQPQQPDDGDDNGMQDFFNRFFGGQGGPQTPQEDQRSGSVGSGFVVDHNGYIITNNHVVDKATRIKVKFMNDDTEYPATVVGTDSDTDLAVIHVEGKKNPVVAKIGNSDALQVGDWAVAIGSPFTFQETVTAGIVSAIARDIPGDATTFQHFIQTDAAINPGNSGGPLANIKGEVIGINTMIASRSGGYQGIGFAMPINTAVKVYNSIIRNGHVTRGSVGITFRETPNNEQLLKVYGADHGVFVATVVPDGPADKAGMKPEDIVTTINGHEVKKGQDLIDLVADSEVGSPIKVGVIRDKKPMTLNVIVADRTRIFAAEYGGAKPGAPEVQPDATQVKFGMSVQALRASDRQNLGYKGSGGVLVASTVPGEFADDIGLQKGDIIVELNRQAVNSPDDIRRIQNTLKPGDAVAFHVMRQAGGGALGARGGDTGDWTSLFLAGSVPAN